MEAIENMSAIERITKASHLIDMKDIIHGGNPTSTCCCWGGHFPIEWSRYYPRWENDAIFETFTRSVMWLKTWTIMWRSWTWQHQLDISNASLFLLQISLRMVKHLRVMTAAGYGQLLRLVSHSVQDAALGEGEGCSSSIELYLVMLSVMLEWLLTTLTKMAKASHRFRATNPSL